MPSTGRSDVTAGSEGQGCTARVGVQDRLWHPFSSPEAEREQEIVIDRGEGVWVWDERGRKYLDASASLWYAHIGHGRQEIADAVCAQMARLETYHIFGDYATPPAIELAERLAARAPDPAARIILVSGGGDAIDTAVKLARLHFHANGRRDRRHVISRSNGYHGTHGVGTSIVGIDAYRTGFGPLMEDISWVEHDSVDALEVEIERVGPGQVAAFVFEPVIGSGGVHPPRVGYLEGIAEVCSRHGVLTIADCVICGFGRLGTWYGVERWGLSPDLITFAKGVTSGYLPLGGVVVSARVMEPFRGADRHIFAHGPTFAGHSSCCAAALANLDILESERLIGRALELERPLYEMLLPLRAHALVNDVRGGVGLMAAVVLDEVIRERDPTIASRFMRAVRDAGVLTRQLEDGLALAPPLIADREHFILIREAFRSALDELERGL